MNVVDVETRLAGNFADADDMFNIMASILFFYFSVYLFLSYAYQDSLETGCLLCYC